MATTIRTVMDALYALCVWVAGTALVLISAVIPWAVYTRYVLNSAASWPEPTAVLLMIVLTFFGAAACYRVGLHMRMSFFAALLPPVGQRLCAVLVEILMALRLPAVIPAAWTLTPFWVMVARAPVDWVLTLKPLTVQLPPVQPVSVLAPAL